MATIFFNTPILKHVSDVTILNFFSEDNGRTIFIRDTRKDVYSNEHKIYADAEFYEDGGDYYIDIVPLREFNGVILGFFVAEGFDFEIKTPSDPVFVVKQDTTETSLSSIPWLQNKSITQMMMGMFPLGTTINFKIDGQPIKEELTKNGWVRVNGPKDRDLGIITIDEAFEKKKKLDKVMEEDFSGKRNEDLIARLTEAGKKGVIPDHLAKSRIKVLNNKEGDNELFMFLTSEIALLRKHNLLK